MKKVVLIIALAITTFMSVNGQEVLNKGDKMFNLGLGLASRYGFIPSVVFSGEVGAIPTGDVGIVTFGGEAEYKLEVWSISNYWYSDAGIKNHLAAGFRAAWHLHVFNNPKYDLYAGLSGGFRMVSRNSNWIEWSYEKGYYTDYSNYYGGYQTVFVGARIMTSDNFGFFGEVASGWNSMSYLRVGMTFKM